MNWFYAGSDGNRVGPLTESEFQAAINEGRVDPDTLVWKKGMPDWAPLSEVGPPQPAANPAGAGHPPLAGGSSVTAENKDEVAQMIREGVDPESGVVWDYGGFWIRFAAYFIDSIILQVITLIIQFGGGALLASVPESSPLFFVGTAMIMLLPWLIAMGYYTYFHGNPKHQATLGKKLLNLRVITAEGEDVSYLRAFGRYWAAILSGLILAIGYIIAAFDDEKRALHDHICNTRVIKL